MTDGDADRAGAEDAVIPFLSKGDRVHISLRPIPSGPLIGSGFTGTVEDTTHHRDPPRDGGFHGEVAITEDRTGITYRVDYNPFQARVARESGDLTDDEWCDDSGVVIGAMTVPEDAENTGGDGDE